MASNSQVQAFSILSQKRRKKNGASAFFLLTTLLLLVCFAAGRNGRADAVPAQVGSASGPKPRSSVKNLEGGVSAGPVRLAAVDAIIQDAIQERNIPGAVLVVGHNGKVIYRRAYGRRALEPRAEVMTLDTVFDLASLTKVVATTTAVMQLVERGKV